MTKQIIQPLNWKRPRGYSNGVAVNAGRLVFIAGQHGWDEQQRFSTDSLVDQIRQALINVKHLMKEGGAKPEHLVRMTWYITAKEEYLANGPAITSVYREVIGTHFPAISMVQVAGLMEPHAKVQIEAMAVVPQGAQTVGTGE